MDEQYFVTQVEAALAKLHYLLSKDLTFDEVSKMLTQNLRGELSD